MCCALEASVSALAGTSDDTKLAAGVSFVAEETADELEQISKDLHALIARFAEARKEAA